MEKSTKSERARDQWVKEKEELEEEIRRLCLQADEQAKLRELDRELWVLRIRDEEHLQWEISALKAQVESRDKGIRLLKDKLKGSQDLLKDHSKSIKRLGQELRDSQRQFYAQEEKVEELETHCFELEIDLREQTSQAQKLHPSPNLKGSAREKQLQNEINKLLQTIKELSVKENTQEKKIRDAQEAASQLRKRARHNTMDDGEIRILLENEVMEMAKGWAKAWGIQELKGNEGVYNSTALHHEVEKVALGSRLEGVSPRVVLNALLCRFISEHIFQQPFPHLIDNGVTVGEPRASQQRQGGVTSFSDAMTKLYSALQKVDEAEAHTWRSQTLQLLSKLQSSKPSLFSQSFNPQIWLSASQTQTVQTLTTAFLTGPTSPLYRPVHNNPKDASLREQELFNLFTTSAQLSFNIWKQRTYLKIRGIEYFRNVPFNCDSKELEPHRMHKLEDGDHSRDGDEVAMVVQPEFVAFGDEDGEGYDRHKIWGKAVVVLA